MAGFLNIVEIEFLCNEVRNRPAIWDPNDDLFNNRAHRTALFVQICTLMEDQFRRIYSGILNHLFFKLAAYNYILAKSSCLIYKRL